MIQMYLLGTIISISKDKFENTELLDDINIFRSDNGHIGDAINYPWTSK